MYTIASGAKHGLRYVKETTPGTTPTSPTMIELNHNSCSLTLTRDTFTSNALRSDRQIPFHRTGVDKIAGDIAFEFGAKEYDVFLEAALAGNWTENVLKAGVAAHAFTFERAFVNINQYAVYTGCFVNQFSLSVKPNEMVGGTFSIVGLEGTRGGTPLSVSPTAAEENNPFDSFTGNLKIDDVSIAVVTGIDLTLANGIEPQYAIFDRQACAVSWGRSTLTGTLSAFYTDGNLDDDFINDSRVKLEFTLTRGDYGYTFLIPNVTLTGADDSAQSEGPIALNIPWSAALDKTSGTNFQITRTVPAVPGP